MQTLRVNCLHDIIDSHYGNSHAMRKMEHEIERPIRIVHRTSNECTLFRPSFEFFIVYSVPFRNGGLSLLLQLKNKEYLRSGGREPETRDGIKCEDGCVMQSV